MTTRTSILLALLVQGSLAACGGSSDPKSPGSGPALRTARGAITEKGTGTITVNGAAISTAGANVKIEDGTHRPENELKKGMIVKVKGTFDDRTGTATEIEFEDAVQGKIDGVAGGVLSVGGQTVKVDDTTHFDDNGGAFAPAVGDRVRVSGAPDDKGGLRATLVQRMTGTADDFEVKGWVSALDAVGHTFTLKLDPADASGYSVSYTPPLPAGVANGSFVEVRSLGPIGGNSIVASSITLEDPKLGVENDEVEVEGWVTSGDSTAFSVNGQDVRTTGTTRWEYGVPADLVPGVKVEAEGHLETGNVLVAHKVSFRAAIRIRAAAANVAMTGLMTGTFTLLGKTVAISPDADWRIAPAALVNGANLEVRAMLGVAGTTLVATRIEDAGSGGGASRPFLQAVATAKSGTAGLTVLGFTVTLAASPSFRDVNENPIDAATFFANVEPGRTVVKVRGASPAAWNGTTGFVAEELELEDVK